MKEHCGLNKKSHDRIAEKALANGIQHNQTKGNLFKWVSSLYNNHKAKGAKILLYGGDAYIFRYDKLITILHIPTNLRNNMDSMIKDKQKYP